MYFWDIESLKEDIRRGEFSDKELIPYIVLSVLFYSIGMEVVLLLPPIENLNLWDTTQSFFNVLIPVIGTLYAYKKNGAANGSDFATKYFSIGFVVGIRFLLYLIGLMIALMIYWNFRFLEQEEIATTCIEVALFSLWLVLLYYKIGHHIEETHTIPPILSERRDKPTYKVLKWFVGSLFVLFATTILYFVVPYYALPDDLNETEATQVLKEQMDIYCKKSYVELNTMTENEPNYLQVEADSGTHYQIEVEIYPYEESDYLLIYATIDNGNRSAYHPMVSTMIKKKSEVCVDE